MKVLVGLWKLVGLRIAVGVLVVGCTVGRVELRTVFVGQVDVVELGLEPDQGKVFFKKN